MANKKPLEYVNTPFGRVLKSSMNQGPSVTTKSVIKLFQSMPEIPNNRYLIKEEKPPVKPSETSNFVEKVQETKADLSIEERLAFMSLTGTEILEISRNFNMSNNSLSLNKNVLDSVIVVNEVNPMQLIKMQETNNSISSNFPKTVEDTKVEISKVTGNSTISAPAPTVVQTQIRVEVHTPRAVFAWGML
jgi:hypothetical protein